MKEYIVRVDRNGTKKWRLNGKLHREDGPAIEYSNGYKGWYLNGKPHREDGPAIEWPDGDKFWYLNGKLHREDGPAVEFTNGNKFWYLNGKLYFYEEWLKKVNPAPCENKVVIIEGQKYKLVAVS